MWGKKQLFEAFASLKSHLFLFDTRGGFAYEFFNPLPDDKILDWSKLTQKCRRHFKVHLK